MAINNSRYSGGIYIYTSGGCICLGVSNWHNSTTVDINAIDRLL